MSNIFYDTTIDAIDSLLKAKIDFEMKEKIIQEYREKVKDLIGPREVNDKRVIVWVFGRNDDELLQFAKQLDTEENTHIITNNSLRGYNQERTCIITKYTESSKNRFPKWKLFQSTNPYIIGSISFAPRIIYILSRSGLEKTFGGIVNHVDKHIKIDIYGVNEVYLHKDPEFVNQKNIDHIVRLIFEHYKELIFEVNMNKDTEEVVMQRFVNKISLSKLYSYDRYIYLCLNSIISNIYELFIEEITDTGDIIRTKLTELIRSDTGTVGGTKYIYDKRGNPILYKTKTGKEIESR